jgi:hypothetical protein
MSDETPILPPLSLDDTMLDQIEHALGTCYKEFGSPELVGGDFTLSQLLDFYSGYDDSKSVLIGHGDPVGLGIGDAPIYEYPDACYSQTDLIAALVAEVRKLRAETPLGGTDDHTG